MIDCASTLNSTLHAIAALRTLRDLARDHPTELRTGLARAAFTEALRRHRRRCRARAITTQPYPGENARA
jgi:hypothetical protein